MTQETIEARIDGLEAQAIELSDVPMNLRLAGEAIRIIRGVLADLVETLPEGAREEYAEDLDRIDQLGHLLL